MVKCNKCAIIRIGRKIYYLCKNTYTIVANRCAGVRPIFLVSYILYLKLNMLKVALVLEEQQNMLIVESQSKLSSRKLERVANP